MRSTYTYISIYVSRYVRNYYICNIDISMANLLKRNTYIFCSDLITQVLNESVRTDFHLRSNWVIHSLSIGVFFCFSIKWNPVISLFIHISEKRHGNWSDAELLRSSYWLLCHFVDSGSIMSFDSRLRSVWCRVCLLIMSICVFSKNELNSSTSMFLLMHKTFSKNNWNCNIILNLFFIRLNSCQFPTTF